MPEIEFAGDGRHFFNQQPLHLLALGPCLVGHQLHAKDLGGVFLGLCQGLGYFYAAALSPAAGMDLRLDHDSLGAAAKQPFGHVQCFFQGVGHFPFGNGYAVALQDVFCLILVNFHSFSLWTELPY